MNYIQKQQAYFKLQTPKIYKALDSGIFDQKGQEILRYYLDFVTGKIPVADGIKTDEAKAILKYIK